MRVMTIGTEQTAEFFHDTLCGIRLWMADGGESGLYTPLFEGFLPMFGLELGTVITKDNSDRECSMEIIDDFFGRNFCLSTAERVELDKFGESINDHENVGDPRTTLREGPVIVDGDKVARLLGNHRVHFPVKCPIRKFGSLAEVTRFNNPLNSSSHFREKEIATDE